MLFELIRIAILINYKYEWWYYKLKVLNAQQQALIVNINEKDPHERLFKAFKHNIMAAKNSSLCPNKGNIIFAHIRYTVYTGRIYIFKWKNITAT